MMTMMTTKTTMIIMTMMMRFRTTTTLTIIMMITLIIITINNNVIVTIRKMKRLVRHKQKTATIHTSKCDTLQYEIKIQATWKIKRERISEGQHYPKVDQNEDGDGL